MSITCVSAADLACGLGPHQACSQVAERTKSSSVLLPDGSLVLIRQVQPGDAPLLADGFARLSLESRQSRFLSRKPNLTRAELRYFTEVDHHDHEAFGALDPVDGRGVGIARYIRHVDDRGAAEVAITVVDEWQRRGLGTELMSRLVDRGRQESICRFTALVAADNAAVVALMGESRNVRATHREPDTVEYEITLPSRGVGDELQALLRASGVAGSRLRTRSEAP